MGRPRRGGECGCGGCVRNFVVVSAVVPEQLADVLDGSRLAGLAGPLYYERGVRYFEDGQVGALRVSAERVAATVRGSDEYAVELRADRGRLLYQCSCPVGREGAFCKRCVAVGLSWLSANDGSTVTLDDARVRLGSLSREELVELLIDHAGEDDALARKLLLLTACPVSQERAEVGPLTVLVDQAFATGGSFRTVRCGGMCAGLMRRSTSSKRCLRTVARAMWLGLPSMRSQPRSGRLSTSMIQTVGWAGSSHGSRRCIWRRAGGRSRIPSSLRSDCSSGSWTATGICSITPSSGMRTCSVLRALRATASSLRSSGRALRSSGPPRRATGSPGHGFGSHGSWRHSHSCRQPRRADRGARAGPLQWLPVLGDRRAMPRTR